MFELHCLGAIDGDGDHCIAGGAFALQIKLRALHINLVDLETLILEFNPEVNISGH